MAKLVTKFQYLKPTDRAGGFGGTSGSISTSGSEEMRWILSGDIMEWIILAQ